MRGIKDERPLIKKKKKNQKTTKRPTKWISDPTRVEFCKVTLIALTTIRSAK